ncbi:MAG: arylsulfatase [Verrucomicrobia bacterium]|nr:arylsulfatase [Verrucomicrobiota bacterium]MCH8513494.1 arylsulfatase [Kiritimatiellia bacterium]
MKNSQPNILLILNDDMGYSDIGCYGGEIHTPHLDGLAANGLRFTQFYNTARCCPSRASLLTGLHPHQADVGHMVGNDQIDGYLGDLSRNAVTLAEVLRTAGYGTAMSGKWHVSGDYQDSHNWPCQRGFERYFGMLCGAGSFWDPHHLKRDNAAIRLEPGRYFTDAISEEAVAQLERHHAAQAERPFFQYLAYTAPHWPLHAPREDIDRYRGRFAKGWDALREERLARMREMGILDPAWEMSARDPSADPWAEEPEKEWQQRRMEAYAAQIDRMDQGIGRVLDAYRAAGRLENTLVLFLSDNGGCAEGIPDEGKKIWGNGRNSGREFTQDGRPVRYGNRPEIIPGAEDTYCSYGSAWANLSNTPFRKFKSWTHEGGISTPLIAHWPKGISASGELRRHPAQLPDIMATILELSGAVYPTEYQGHAIKPCEGFSMVPMLAADVPHEREALVWEHQGNAAVRRGPWKLVRDHPAPWELYNIEKDRAETTDHAETMPEMVHELETLWQNWADRVGVRDWDWLKEHRRQKREGSPQRQ